MENAKLNLDNIYKKIKASEEYLNASEEEQTNILKVYFKAVNVSSLSDFYDFSEMLANDEDLQDIPFLADITDEIIKQNRFLNIGEHYDKGDFCFIDLRELPPKHTSLTALKNWNIHIFNENWDWCFGFDCVELSEELEEAIGYTLIDIEKEKNYQNQKTENK